MSSLTEPEVSVGRRIVERAYRLAKASPEFVYEPPGPNAKCFYVHSFEKREGGCLFGQAALAVGISFEQVKEWDRREDAEIGTILYGEFEERDSNLIDRANKAQTLQDQSMAWGDVADVLAPLFEKGIRS